MMEWGLTDAFDKLSDSITNPTWWKCRYYWQSHSMTNTSDNNTDTSDENHINPSDNLTPNNAEPDKGIFNVSNDTLQKIYLEELD